MILSTKNAKNVAKTIKSNAKNVGLGSLKPGAKGQVAVETKNAKKVAKAVAALVVETKPVETVAAKVVAKVSNKARIYALWLKNKDADPVLLRNKAKAQSAVKEQTVTNWVNGWAKGKRLPGCARKSA